MRAGDAITPHYDPMIAKLIVHGVDRDRRAHAHGAGAGTGARVVGLHTNVGLPGPADARRSLAAADLDTGLIERRRDSLLPSAAAASPSLLALATAALLARENAADAHGRHGEGTAGSRTVGGDPWDARDGWRVDGRYERHIRWRDGDTRRAVALKRDGDAWTVSLDAAPPRGRWQWDASARAEAGQDAAWDIRLVMDDADIRGTAVWTGDGFQVFQDGDARQLALDDPLAHAGEDHGEHGGDMTAPMPGKIISISVRAGDAVRKGQALLVMEAMKMEHNIAAATDGQVAEVFYAVGDQVAEGATLIALKQRDRSHEKGPA